jgi:nucleolar protein 4
MQLQFGVKKDMKSSKERKAQFAEAAAAAAPVDVKPKVTKTKEPTDEEKTNEDKESAENVRRTRQMLVFGIPIDVDKKAFKAVVQKISRKAIEIELIKEDHKLSSSLTIVTPPGKVMLITAPSRQEAQKIIDALNVGTIHNLGFSKFVDSKSPTESEGEDNDALDGLRTKNRLKERLVARTLADITEGELRKRKCRLIVRSLSFQATQQNVVDKLKKFGPIVDVDIPTSTVELAKSGKRRRGEDDVSGTVVKERMKGFAFVTFLCEKDAKLAVEQGSTLKICNRDVAIDFCMSKESYLKYGKDVDEDGQEQVAGNGIDSDKDVAEMAGMDEDAEDNGAESDNDDDDNDVDHVEDDNDVEDENDVEVSAKDASVDLPTEKRTLTGDVREGRTVFVRGLPFDATPPDVKRVFGKFGRIEMALIVMDKQTGVSKGSAFVKFVEKSSAEKCLLGVPAELTVKDKLCVVNLAVDKDSVEKLKTDARAGRDKRNLYLANEGLVADATQTMSDYDREKRLRAQSDKKKKLQNPLFFVSNSRLSIRNLGKKVTDQELRVACLKATKMGLEKGLVTAQDMQNLNNAQGSQWNNSDSSTTSAATPLTVPTFDGRHCVKTAKIMFDLGKVRDGLAQSRGYGFIEFYHHAFALACLRQLNNNSQYENLAADVSKEVSTSKSRLLVEFSLENIRKVSDFVVDMIRCRAQRVIVMFV